MANTVITQPLIETPAGYREQIVSIRENSGYEIDVAIVRRIRTSGSKDWLVTIGILAVRVQIEHIPFVRDALTRAQEIAAAWAAKSEGDDD